MKIFKTIKNTRGFSIIEVLVAFGLILTFAMINIDFSELMRKNSAQARTIAVRDRVLSGVRTLAGMPAALRNSMRASIGGVAVNTMLLACAGGNPANSCKNGESVGFTLYSPIMVLSSLGKPLAIQPVTSPPTAANPLRFDIYGSPCIGAPADCPILVFTTMRAQCGPAAIAAIPPYPISLATLNFTPAATCTVASVIEVTYEVKVDSAVATSNPALASFVTPITGSVVTSVKAISGNTPQ